MFNRFDRFNMRKVVRNLITLTVISFAAGTVILFTSNGGQLIAKSKEISSANQVKEEKIEGVDKITISSTSAQIIVIPEKRNNIKAELTGNSSTNNVELQTNQSGDKLDIGVENKITIGINFSFANLKLYVYIPEDYSKSLDIKSTSGKIEIGKIKLNELSCRSTSGSVEINEASAEEFDYSNTSGSLKVGILNTKETNLKSTSGSINIESFNGDLIGSQTSGSINIDYKSFDNDVELHSVSGSVKLNLPESSQFELDARSTSGSINSEFPITIEGEQDRNKRIGYVGSKKNKISIKTTSGSIRIEK